MKKKIIAFVSAIALMTSIAACDSKDSKSEPTKKDEVVTENETTKAEETEKETEATTKEEPEATEDETPIVSTTGMMMYQFDKDNMDVDYNDEDVALTTEDLEKYGEVTQITENGMTFYAVDEDVFIRYYISKDDYKNRLTEVDVTLDIFDQYFELVKEEVWEDDRVEFHEYYRLKDDYLFAMVDYDHLYDNTADATCHPIDYMESTIDVDNETYDWGVWDTSYDELEVWIDFEETEDSTYRNVIVSTWQDNYIEDNGDDTAYGVAHEDLTLTDVTIKFYYLK